MEREHLVRLECLKLAHAHGRSAEEAIVRAREYEKFVLQGLKVETKVPEKTVTVPVIDKVAVKKKNAGNPNVFD